jgi:hypothetical protein
MFKAKEHKRMVSVNEFNSDGARDMRTKNKKLIFNFLSSKNYNLIIFNKCNVFFLKTDKFNHSFKFIKQNFF